MSEAARYARIADRFGACVGEIAPHEWDKPSPCVAWRARDVVTHLTEWVPEFFVAYAGLTVPDLEATHDPRAGWESLDRVLRRWLADPAVSGRLMTGPMGECTVAQAIDRFVATDVLIHTWDLARSVGLDDRLDAHEIAGMAEAMEPIDAQLRASGHYGPRVAVAAHSSEQDRLLAFLGRDPRWRPSSSA